MNENWLAIALGVGTAAVVATRISRVRRRRDENKALKTEIRKWEDEGGNVPEVPTPRPLSRSGPSRLSSLRAPADRGAGPAS